LTDLLFYYGDLNGGHVDAKEFETAAETTPDATRLQSSIFIDHFDHH